MFSQNKIPLIIASIAGVLALLVIMWFEYLKKHDTENWNGTAMYGIKATPEEFRPPEKATPTLEEMRDFAFGKKK